MAQETNHERLYGLKQNHYNLILIIAGLVSYGLYEFELYPFDNTARQEFGVWVVIVIRYVCFVLMFGGVMGIVTILCAGYRALGK